MSSSRTPGPFREKPAMTGATLLGGLVLAVLVLAAPAAAHTPAQEAAGPLASGRFGGTAAAVVGLIGVVAGALALARPGGRPGTGTGRRGALVALVAGPVAMVFGGLFTATADGGLGTGNGLGGSVVALLLGLTATSLGAPALARSRRAVRSG
ncbi:DUF6223 family protein [Streptomyces sp. S07_1.15]|uniref:DUF6223 family protein n=1 Tax=Streptomyces sp. S07_1.15 TaxID=2873925 RepID=UPI001D1421F7|nr:DUF6223 family protein [Streptomyces sp. S07_1.15]MCC3651223.1 DUF6223 family protein [Streptomyces sp. S07_1.15]